MILGRHGDSDRRRRTIACGVTFENGRARVRSRRGRGRPALAGCAGWRSVPTSGSRRTWASSSRRSTSQGYRPRDELVAVMHAEVGFQALRVSLRDDVTRCSLSRSDTTAACRSAASADTAGTVAASGLAARAGRRRRILERDAARPTRFYFDAVSQIRMPSWTRGRVALVGDAAACPSLLAGQGSALAMVEALRAGRRAGPRRRGTHGRRSPATRRGSPRCCGPSRTRREGLGLAFAPTEPLAQLCRAEHGDEADGTAEGAGSGHGPELPRRRRTAAVRAGLSGAAVPWFDLDSPSSPAQQQAILRAALEEFAAHGFHDASLNRVIEAAGHLQGLDVLLLRRQRGPVRPCRPRGARAHVRPVGPVRRPGSRRRRTRSGRRWRTTTSG